MGLATRLIWRKNASFPLLCPRECIVSSRHMVAASRHKNLPSRWSSNHIVLWEILHDCWVTPLRPDFWPYSISEMSFQKDYCCFQHFFPMQAWYRIYMPGEEPPQRMGCSSTLESNSGTLGSPRGWGKAASPCCLNSLWRVARSQHMTSAEGSTGWGLFCFTVKVRSVLMSKNFAPSLALHLVFSICQLSNKA